MKKEIIGLYILLVVGIIIMLINKFPIVIEMKENKQVWEANCKCECIEQEPKPCVYTNWKFNFSIPKSSYVNFTEYPKDWFNSSQECRTHCWENPSKSTQAEQSSVS